MRLLCFCLDDDAAPAHRATCVSECSLIDPQQLRVKVSDRRVDKLAPTWQEAEQENALRCSVETPQESHYIAGNKLYAWWIVLVARVVLTF